MNIIFEGLTKTGRNFFIRYPTSQDAQIMCDYINILSQEKTYILFQGEQVSLQEEQEFLDSQLEAIKNNNAMLLLAFVEDKLVGVSGVTMSNRAERHIGTVGLSITKEYRKEGIGRKLMETIIQQAIITIPQLEIITLGVFANNTGAIELYKKLGFQEYGNLPQGIYYRNEKVDHIYMFKKVR